MERLFATPKMIPNLSFSIEVEVSIKSGERASPVSESAVLGAQASCLPSVRSTIRSRLPALSAGKMPALPAQRSQLMFEMADARKNHSDVLFIASRDHFCVAQRAAGLNDGG